MQYAHGTPSYSLACPNSLSIFNKVWHRLVSGHLSITCLWLVSPCFLGSSDISPSLSLPSQEVSQAMLSQITLAFQNNHGEEKNHQAICRPLTPPCHPFIRIRIPPPPTVLALFVHKPSAPLLSVIPFVLPLLAILLLLAPLLLEIHHRWVVHCAWHNFTKLLHTSLPLLSPRTLTILNQLSLLFKQSTRNSSSSRQLASIPMAAQLQIVLLSLRPSPLTVQWRLLLSIMSWFMFFLIGVMMRSWQHCQKIIQSISPLLAFAWRMPNMATITPRNSSSRPSRITMSQRRSYWSRGRLTRLSLTCWTFTMLYGRLMQELDTSGMTRL